MEDIEMELDLGDPTLQTEDLNFDAPTDSVNAHDSSSALVPQPELPISAEPVPNKVHIRGLDNLTTADVIGFAREHFAEEEAKLEWIDDTSANLVYSTPELALSALSTLGQLSSTTDPNPLQLRYAKALAGHPDTVLSVRTAVSTDRKKARAAEESRFYLLNPEHDPREQRRRRYSGREHRRRLSRDRRAGYSADMYDEGGDRRTGHSRRRSSGSGSVISTSDEAERLGRRQRRRRHDRSRSPGRGGPDARSRSPRNRGKELIPSGPRHATSNRGKELLPRLGRTSNAKTGVLHEADERTTTSTTLNTTTSTSTTTTATAAAAATNVTPRAGGAGRELFPDRVSGMEGLFGRSMAVPFVDGANETSDSSGVRIRGAAGDRGTKEGQLSIRGAATADRTDAKIRELFPDHKRAARGLMNDNRSKKNLNSGKELFAGDGGGRKERERADRFY